MNIRQAGVLGNAARRPGQLRGWALLLSLICTARPFPDAVHSQTITGSHYSLGTERHLPGGEIHFSNGSILRIVECSPQLCVSGSHVIAAWINPAGDIYWAWSVDRGETWKEGSRILPTGGWGIYTLSGVPAASVDERGLFELCFRHGKSGYGGSLEVATFAPSGDTLRLVSRVPSSPVPPGQPEFTGTRLPRLSFDPGASRLYEAYIFTKASTVDPGASDLTVALAARDGSTWSRPVMVGGRRSNGVRLAVGADGEVVLVWKDMSNMNRNLIKGARSTDGGVTFDPPFTVGEAFDYFWPSSGYQGSIEPGPAPACWDQVVRNHPSMAVDRSHGPRRGTIYVVWTNSIRGQVAPATRTRGEQEPNASLETATPIEIGENVTGSCAHSDGMHDVDVFSFEGEAGQTVRIVGNVQSNAPGNQIGVFLQLGCNYTQDAFPVGILAYLTAGPPDCEPILYTLPSSGRYFLRLNGDNQYNFSYTLQVRALTPDGENPARDVRDVVLASSADGGVTWTEPRVVNDDPPYFENLLPEVAVDGLGGVHVSWYDRRDDEECGAGTNVYCRYSQDGGRTFFPSQRMSDSTSSMDWREYNYDPTLFLGDYMALTAEGTDVYAAWTQTAHSREQDFNKHDIHFRSMSVSPDIRMEGLKVESHARVQNISWDVSLPDFLWKFRVLRGSTESGPFQLLGEVAATARGARGYEVVDSTATPGQNAVYRIEGLRADEEPLPIETVSVMVSDLPDGPPVWRAIAPNPFSGRMELVFDSPRAKDAELRVFDQRGAMVRTLHRGRLPQGVSRILWDGLADNSGVLPNGVYFIQLTGRDFRESRKVVLLRGSAR